jgi:hypothetical protein
MPTSSQLNRKAFPVYEKEHFQAVLFFIYRIYFPNETKIRITAVIFGILYVNYFSKRGEPDEV